jgi:hypothetical protein
VSRCCFQNMVEGIRKGRWCPWRTGECRRNVLNKHAAVLVGGDVGCGGTINLFITPTGKKALWGGGGITEKPGGCCACRLNLACARPSSETDGDDGGDRGAKGRMAVLARISLHCRALPLFTVGAAADVAGGGAAVPKAAARARLCGPCPLGLMMMIRLTHEAEG